MNPVNTEITSLGDSWGRRMRVEFINPFLASTRDVFQTMLGCEIQRGEVRVKDTRTPGLEVSGMIGLSGRVHGMVVVSFSRATSLKIAEVMLGETFESIDADVVDAVGEVTNMIAGGAKARLEKYQLSIGLPTVICGKNHIINFPSNSVPISMPFDSPIGSVCVDVGIVVEGEEGETAPEEAATDAASVS